MDWETERIKEAYINGASGKLLKYKKGTEVFRTVTVFKGRENNRGWGEILATKLSFLPTPAVGTPFISLKENFPRIRKKFAPAEASRPKETYNGGRAQNKMKQNYGTGTGKKALNS